MLTMLSFHGYLHFRVTPYPQWSPMGEMHENQVESFYQQKSRGSTPGLMNQNLCKGAHSFSSVTAMVEKNCSRQRNYFLTVNVSLQYTLWRKCKV